MTNLSNDESPTWTKYIEIYKRDEGKRRQISGPRNFVSEAKMYRYTRGTGNRNRGNFNNFRGNRENTGNNNYQGYRDNYSREEVNEKVQNAARMERFIQISGEPARDHRRYDRHYDSEEKSDISFAQSGGARSEAYNSDIRSQVDSLEFESEIQEITGKNQEKQSDKKQESKPENDEEAKKKEMTTE